MYEGEESMTPCALSMPQSPADYSIPLAPTLPTSWVFARHFGRMVQLSRDRQGLTIAGLAAQLHVSAAWVEAIETGDAVVSLEHALMLAIPLKFSLDTLYSPFKAMTPELATEIAALLPLFSSELRVALFELLHHYASRDS